MNGLVITWIIFGVPIGLILIGCLYKMSQAKYKWITVTCEDGSTYQKKVEDLEYHYKPEELWEPPPYWTNWQMNERLTVVDHGVEINDHGDNDWHNEQHI